ncbi:HlyD family secretion protein [Ruegeria sp. THAF33]|uniref:HlyD family secretion protein n=1 Tax=Ruegeria sp. THAF33 TaxID=2587853 RepID=UPI0012685121|nr:biotin/lipoyl-binding protein [Ruegeria sp. THAF33]QFT75416.1 Inner membrane protein YibH [Ruegeria sp. THAF33]
MLIVLGLYFGVIWVVFSKLGLLPWNRFWKSVVYGGAAIIALVVIGALNHTTPTGPVSVQGVATNIAPNVSGTVVDVSVRPNERVAKGDPLFRIDDTPFRIEVARLTASLETARSAADQLQSDLAAAEADIESLTAQLTFGVQRRDDIVDLEKRGASTTFQLQEAVSAIDQLSASLRAAEARKAGLERRIAAKIDGIDAGVVEAEQALAQALWNLEQTVVRAPEDGFVTAVSLRPGNRVSIAQGAISFVVPDDRHLIASLPQSSRMNVSVGDQIRLALRIEPGGEIHGTVISLPVGTAEGVVDSRTGLPSLRDLAGVSSYPVLIEVPDQINIEDFPFGTSGTALVITDKAGAISVLAEILFWITKKLNYI